jgi:hypothetical protein
VSRYGAPLVCYHFATQLGGRGSSGAGIGQGRAKQSSESRRIVGTIELQGTAFAAYTISGEAIGRFHLSDAQGC